MNKRSLLHFCSITAISFPTKSCFEVQYFDFDLTYMLPISIVQGYIFVFLAISGGREYLHTTHSITSGNTRQLGERKIKRTQLPLHGLNGS